MPRIRILGASGSGTSTLGDALARRLAVPHTDSDSLYWLPSDPPYTAPRPPEARQALLRDLVSKSEHFVFSGATTHWTTPLEPHCDLVVFLYLDPTIRMVRLRRREAERFGARIQPNGDMAATHRAFIAWAEAYDTDGPAQASLFLHTAWLADQPAPVLRLDSYEPLDHLVTAVEASLL